MMYPANVKELVTVPGDEPNTAIRVKLVRQAGDAHVVLEHRAYTPDLGWYTQKSFRLPTAVLSTLATQFGFADALTRHATGPTNRSRARATGDPIPFPGPPMPRPHTGPRRHRRDA
jgi:hypothetical protein